MKMIKYIFTLAVLFALFYAFGFCIFYGMSVEDKVFIFLAIFFAVLLYVWNNIMQPAKNEYTKKLITFLRKMSVEG
jgi:hypothetical protein